MRSPTVLLQLLLLLVVVVATRDVLAASATRARDPHRVRMPSERFETTTTPPAHDHRHHRKTTPATRADSAFFSAPTPANAGIIWHKTYGVPIVNSVAMTLGGTFAAIAVGSNEVGHDSVDMLSSATSTKPFTTVLNGGNNYVVAADASKRSPTFTVTNTLGDATQIVSRIVSYDTTTARTTSNNTLHNCFIGSGPGIAPLSSVDAAGSRVVLGVTEYPLGPSAPHDYHADFRAYVNGVRVAKAPAANVTGAGFVQLSTDGSTSLAVTASGSGMRLTVQTWPFAQPPTFTHDDTSGSSLACICASPNLKYFAAGAFGISAFRATASTYAVQQLALPFSPADSWVCGGCAISDAGVLTVAAENYRNGYLSTALATWGLANTGAARTLWTWMAPVDGAAGEQDAIARVSMTPTGQHVAYCSWGSKAHSPTLRVFKTHNTTAAIDPIAQFHTPGSPFWCEADYENPSTLLVVLGGKHALANQFGDGGDAWMLSIPV